MTPKEKALDKYIREKHNQDECVGFIDGYEKCKEDIWKYDITLSILCILFFIGLLYGFLFLF